MQRNKPANYNVNVKMSDCRQRDGGSDDHNYYNITRLRPSVGPFPPPNTITHDLEENINYTRPPLLLCSNTVASQHLLPTPPPSTPHSCVFLRLYFPLLRFNIIPSEVVVKLVYYYQFVCVL